MIESVMEIVFLLAVLGVYFLVQEYKKYQEKECEAKRWQGVEIHKIYAPDAGWIYTESPLMNDIFIEDGCVQILSDSAEVKATIKIAAGDELKCLTGKFVRYTEHIVTQFNGTNRYNNSMVENISPSSLHLYKKEIKKDADLLLETLIRRSAPR